MGGARSTGALLVLALTATTLAGCTAAEPAPVATTFGTGILPAEQDLGSASDQRAVRAAVVAGLSEEMQAFAVDRGLRGRKPAAVLEILTAAGPTRARAELLSRSHTARLAKDLEEAFLFFARQDFRADRTGDVDRAALLDTDVWADVAFHVDRWEGVRIAGDTARVLVHGEDRGTAWGGRAKRDHDRQEQLVLYRDPTAPHGWRIVDHGSATLGV